MGALVKTTVGTSIKSVSSANYTVTTSDGYNTVLVSTGAANRTITLPAAASSLNRQILVKKSDSGAGAVLIARAGSDTIEGQTTVYIYKQYDEMELVCDGTSWYVLSEQITPLIFSLYAQNNASNSVSTPTGSGVVLAVVAYDFTQYDNYSATASQIFTVPAGMGGMYEFNFSARVQCTSNSSDGTGFAYFYPSVNSASSSNSTKIASVSVGGSNTDFTHTTGTLVLSLNAGQTVQMFAEADGVTGTGTITWRYQFHKWEAKLLKRIR